MAKSKGGVRKSKKIEEQPIPQPAPKPIAQQQVAQQPVTATQLMTDDSTKNFITIFVVMLIAAAIFFFVYYSNNGGPCQKEEGSVLCGYCSEDAALSDNPNAGKCRYCPSGTRCSYDSICGDLTCTTSGSSGGSSGGGSNQQYCDTGYCYSAGFCCPKGTPYYCNGYCYTTSGANQHGCYTLKAICY
jgi:hypothetical protein